MFFEIIILGWLNDKKINKKFVASSVVLTLLPSVLTGCTQGLKYEENENGQVIVSGNITYNTLKNYYFVEIENPDFENIDYYLTYRDTIKPLENLIYVYKDILQEIL